MARDEDPIQRRDWDDELTPPRAPGALLSDEDRRSGILTTLVVLVVVALGAIGATLMWSERQIDTLVATGGRLSSTASGDDSVVDVALGVYDTVYFHVVLQGAPYGRRLDLRCDWIDATGEFAGAVEYETARVTRTDWPTHCRHRFGVDDKPGEWTVRMSLDDRALGTFTFTVVPRRDS